MKWDVISKPSYQLSGLHERWNDLFPSCCSDLVHSKWCPPTIPSLHLGSWQPAAGPPSARTSWYLDPRSVLSWHHVQLHPPPASPASTAATAPHNSSLLLSSPTAMRGPPTAQCLAASIWTDEQIAAGDGGNSNTIQRSTNYCKPWAGFCHTAWGAATFWQWEANHERLHISIFALLLQLS